MVGIVIVSHSRKIAEGIQELAEQVAASSGRILAAGGLEDGEIGTDAVRISDAIRAADDGDGVAVLADLGSGIMSAETAVELLDGEGIDVRLADAPVVEGAIAAAVEAACGSGIAEVIRAAEEARFVSKNIETGGRP
ncbi:MAG: PTS-dependent dihydroxyacetone kinase phosphotransferase subunit DhaM [Clostridia bacterium]|nr:PTS-dependent dihydroxyacetone kinase phosphotransferase subunit DhaM [Clostridia bacterium]